MKVVFASGGTGGHIYPALALADEMRRRFDPFEPLFVGTGSGLESSLIGESGYHLKFIISGPVRGRSLLGRAGTIFGLAAGTVQALAILGRFRPDLVIGFGGYASASVVIAASVLRRTIVLQEQNSVPGMANRLLARSARRIYLGFGHAAGFFREPAKTVNTGNPLRRMITEEYTGDPHSAFRLDPALPVLLVFGGSQGASSLNRASVEYLKSERGVQGIIQTGRKDYRSIRDALSGCRERVFVTEYIDNIREAYETADIIISRAGALSVSEIAAVGVPSILVPYPHAADNHQMINARYLEEAGGAVIVKDSELSGEKLAGLMEELLNDSARLERMKQSARSLAAGDSSARIVDDIESLIGTERG
jgi:UDP-N-acetylglucosamine--N-acetylmuramyl-(pentapeptide) pyrophosphoryl-undecaprenol N-acetylglucosamine transferase